MEAVVCLHFKFGYCKFKELCRNRHEEALCENVKCDVQSCDLRHPKHCKYHLKYGFCKFNACLYKHEKIGLNSTTDTDNLFITLRELIEEKDAKIVSLSRSLEILEQRVKKLEEAATAECDTPLPIVNAHDSTFAQPLISCDSSMSDSSCHIPQVDGAVDMSYNCGVISQKGPKYCGFCDEEFYNREDFTIHMKLVRYKCNNCLDYFTDKQWFSFDNLTTIKTGVVLTQP